MAERRPGERYESDSERISARKQQQKKYFATRIALGSAHEEWERQRVSSGLSHIAFSKHLLDIHKVTNCVCRNPVCSPVPTPNPVTSETSYSILKGTSGTQTTTLMSTATPPLVASTASQSHPVSDFKMEAMDIPHAQSLKYDLSNSDEQFQMELYSQQQQTDITLVVDDVKIKCHKFILSAASSYFSTMLAGGHDIMRINGVNGPTLHLIVEFMYTSHVVITSENIQVVHEAAKFFNLSFLISKCEQFAFSLPEDNQMVDTYGGLANNAAGDINSSKHEGVTGENLDDAVINGDGGCHCEVSVSANIDDAALTCDDRSQCEVTTDVNLDANVVPCDARSQCEATTGTNVRDVVRGDSSMIKDDNGATSNKKTKPRRLMTRKACEKSVQKQQYFRTLDFSNKSFLCKTCNEGFPLMAHLNAHALTHLTDGPPYQCTDCDWSGHINNAKVHMLHHTGERPFSCTICSKTFLTEGVIVEHIRVHLGEIRFFCDFCGKGFPTSSEFRRHYSCHSHVVKPLSSKRFKCGICIQSFKDPRGLKIHIHSKHTGERPFCCEICGRTFTTSCMFKMHSHVHKGLKPHKCNMCWKSFTRATNLKVHKNIHTGQIQHECQVCQKTFSQAWYLKVHLSKHTGSDQI